MWVYHLTVYSFFKEMIYDSKNKKNTNKVVYTVFFALILYVCRRRFCVDGTLASDFRNDRMRIRQRFIVPTWNCALFCFSAACGDIACFH